MGRGGPGRGGSAIRGTGLDAANPARRASRLGAVRFDKRFAQDKGADKALAAPKDQEKMMEKESKPAQSGPGRSEARSLGAFFGKALDDAALDALEQAVRWDDRGLVCAVCQDHATGQVRMLAWMNKEALRKTVETGHAHYYSRSRQKLWKKGESSGNEQIVKELRLDCDGDAIVMRIEQVGNISCHTGRASCFFKRWNGRAWEETDKPIKSESEIYGSRAGDGAAHGDR